MPAGRPSKYDPAFCDVVIEMGAQGASVVEMCARVGVARNTLEVNWTRDHSEFADALDYAKLLSQAWWERVGREGMLNKSICPNLWGRNMGARFPRDWRENKGVELTGADGGAIQQAITVEFVSPGEDPDS